MANYCAKSDVAKVYGTKSVEKWAELDGDESPNTISERIAWACTLATEYVNSRLMRTHYEVPFTNVPVMIVNITAMYAGVLLCDGRRVIDADQPDEVRRQRKDVDRYIRQILKGQLKLLHPTTGAELDVIVDYQSPHVIAVQTTEEQLDADGRRIIFGE